MATLRDYLQVVRRRKWIIIASSLIVPAVALVFSLQQQAMYEGSSQVLLAQQDLASQITGTQGPTYNDPADRQAQTQASLARVPNVAARAIRALHLNMTPAAFLAASSVTAGANADTLSFAVSNHDPQLAPRMATAYANAYVAYRLQVETAPIEAARKGLEARLKTTPRGALYNSLVDKDQTLAELEALKTSNASVIRDGGAAIQTAPKTKRNVTLGILFGLILGIGLAFLRETLDTRIRSAESIGERLGLPLLARLPAPSKHLRDTNHLAMLDEPMGLQAEAFRMLRTNLEFATLGRDIRSIMVTSALEKEGKSTTISNLAVALARAGRRVVLVDLDLRRPFVNRLFDLDGAAGVTQVALGHLAIDDALVPVKLDGQLAGPQGIGPVARAARPARLAGAHGNGNGGLAHGSLHVLPSGPIPPDPGEFVGTARLTEILGQLRERAEIILIDAPPLFHVGDGMTLSAKVDAMIVVARLEVMRRPMLAEMHRLVETMPAAKLGFVVTGAEAEEGYGDGYGGYYYYRSYEQHGAEELRSGAGL